MTTTPAALDQTISISVYLRRDQHENGMTLAEYADAVIAGTQPVLEHDAFVYQFGSVHDEIDLVVAWAQQNNLSILNRDGVIIHMIKLLGTVAQFNSLFSIELQTVTEDNRTYITHTGTITVPSEINDVVEYVLGLDNSVRLSHYAHLDTSTAGDLDPSVIANPTPVDLALAYQFPRCPGGDLAQGKGQTVAIIELGGGWTTQNLTSTFGRIGQPNPTIFDVYVDGATNDPTDTNGSGEVMLDIYCVGAVAPAAKLGIYFGQNSFVGFQDVLYEAIYDTTNAPSIISISWGTTDTNWDPLWRGGFETDLQAAVVRGITTFVAAGDFGVKAISSASTYTVQYPGTSAYVVCAGGTVLSINNDYSIASEIPWGTTGGSYAGGGGVSTLYGVPAWQTGFTSKLYPGGSVSSLTGRGIPDVSAMATGYQCYYSSSNTFGTFVGTSATAPLLAGMMARLNQLSGRNIGFVNSDWYGVRTTAFNDQTTGDNHGGNSVGYQATTGWDACTGIGSPIGVNIFQLYNQGQTYPAQNYGFRPASGQSYPRLDISLTQT